MNRQEEDDLQEQLRRIEMYMPPAWVTKFGEWDQFKERVLKALDDENSLYQELETAKEDAKDWEDKYDDLKDDIQDIVDDMKCLDVSDSEQGEEMEKLIKKLDDAL